MAPTSTSVRKSSRTKWAALPLGISLVIFGLALTPFSKNLDWGLYDVFLGLRAEPPSDPSILLLDVDDTAIEKLGAWPWPRSYMAQALPILAEFGAGQVVFDIEYNTPSPPGVNRSYLEHGLRTDFDLLFSDVTGQVADLFGALKTRQIPMSEADAYVNDLIASAGAAKERILVNSQKIAQDNDLALAKAMGFFGSTTLALRFDTVANPGLSSADRQKIAQRFALSDTATPASAQHYRDVIASRAAMVERAAAAGFVNVEIDADGKRRRVRLVEPLEGKNYGQLVLPALLQRLGNPAVRVFDDHILLEKAQLADGPHDIRIPLDEKGFLLINWPRRSYAESFPGQHVSIYYLINYAQQVDELTGTLTALSLRDAWKVVGMNPALDLVQTKRDLDRQEVALLETSSAEQKAVFWEQRTAWFASVADFLGASYEEALAAELKRQADQNPSAQQSALFRDEAAGVAGLFANLKASLAAVQLNREVLAKQLAGTLCIVGYVGTGTSDLGATPFQKDYVNVGTHASVANTILQQQFLSESPTWIPLVLILLLPIALYFALNRLSVGKQILAGSALVGALFGSAIVLFLTTGTYLPILAPLVATVLTFVIYSLIQFLGETREKAFIRKAWGTYLSEDIINQIVDDPEKLKLGGESRHMTAMFTDVKGFSTISEQLTASELVLLLNTYLSGMSDIILNESGVIDKFEGDAIIAFWGAPLELPSHAGHALKSALQMRAWESEFNRRVIEERLSPVELYTRFGVNTGEMVAGNMGTDRKMNYTIMGNAVNLAARLEGVNKQYGTWILTTEATAQEAGPDFLYRPLDRVRVVGIKTPVRLMEVVDLTAQASTATKGFLADFQGALSEFEARRWAKAEAGFRELLRQNPNDGPSNLYARRSAEYGAKEPVATWDGVFNLTEK